MSEQVIEAAAREFWEEYRRQDGFSTGWPNLREHRREWYRRGTEAAIRAADEARAPEIIAAVDALFNAAYDLGGGGSDEPAHAAYHKLLSLFGIAETE